MKSNKVVLTASILSCILISCKNNNKNSENETPKKEQKLEKIVALFSAISKTENESIVGSSLTI